MDVYLQRGDLHGSSGLVMAQEKAEISIPEGSQWSPRGEGGEMSDYQNHPTIQALLARKRPTPGEHEAICTFCDGLGTVLVVPGTGRTCPRCTGTGLLPLCPYCGRLVEPIGYPQCQCSDAEEQRRAERHTKELARWRRYPPITWTEAEAAPVWSETLECVFYDYDTLEEAWWEHLAEPKGDLPPIDPEWALLYDCDPLHLHLDAGELLDAWSEWHGGCDWNPLDDLPGKACGELQKVLDAWTEKWGRDLGYEPNYSRPVLPPGA